MLSTESPILNFQVCGAVVLAAGIWITVVDEFDYYFSIVDFNNGNHYYDVALWILIVIGGIMFLVGFFGCCGACTESTKCLHVVNHLFISKNTLEILNPLSKLGKKHTRSITFHFLVTFQLYLLSYVESPHEVMQQPSFSIIPHALSNNARILPGLTFNGFLPTFCQLWKNSSNLTNLPNMFIFNFDR